VRFSVSLAFLKTDFPCLLDKALQRANPGQLLTVVFEKCRLFPINLVRAVKKVPHKKKECHQSVFGITMVSLEL
jgi:hypothetical protein